MSLQSERSEAVSGVSREERVLSWSAVWSRWAAASGSWSASGVGLGRGRADEDSVCSGMFAGGRSLWG